LYAIKNTKVDQQILSLFNKFIENQCTAAELTEVNDYLKSGRYRAEWEYLINREAEAMFSAEQVSSTSDDTDRPLKERLFHSITQTEKYKHARLINWRFAAAAAAIFIIFGLTVIFIRKGSAVLPMVSYQGRPLVQPGQHLAFIRTAGGLVRLSTNHSMVQLNAKGFIYEDGSAVKNQADDDPAQPRLHRVASDTLITPKGGKYALVLNDGTKVWLNAASSLIYPEKFGPGARLVKLNGEAYFEVVHDASRPFKVMAQNQVIEDLGTHFNINCYPDEGNVKTSLLEGKVKVSQASQSVVLSPGQQVAGLPSSRNILLLNDPDETIAWKNGFFHFESADIKEVLRRFSRWYNIAIVYDGNVRAPLFSGDIHTDLEIDQALKLLSYAKVHFLIDGRKITVSTNENK
jgi:transmembrane sensor